MAVREYVGARYVPKFSDLNGGDWDNTYSYESLIIVKYGNDYYTSKKAVPVGIAITNTDYWVKTGDYNGAISTLQGEIDTLKSYFPSVKEYGAVGDGVTDDSAAIQACADANTFVFFPEGEYVCKLVKANNNNYFYGHNATLKLARDLTAADVIGELESDYDFQFCSILYGDGVSDVTIDNLIFDCDSAARTSDALKYSDSIFFFNSERITTINTYVKDSLNHGIEYYRCRDSIMNNCISDYAGNVNRLYGVSGGDNFILHAACVDCIITNCIAHNGYDISFEIEGRGGGTLSAEKCINCVIESSISESPRAHGFLVFNSRDCQISGCISRGSNGSTGTGDRAGFQIVGGFNNILSNLVSENDGQYAVSITDESQGSDLYPNSIVLNGLTEYHGGGVHLLNATNCKISNLNLAADVTVIAHSTIHIENCENIMADNIRAFNQDYAIYVKNSQKVHVNNLLSNAAIYGIFAEGASTIIADAIVQLAGTLAYKYSGSNPEYVILNSVSEVKTSSDITTVYGSFAFITINAHTYIAP